MNAACALTTLAREQQQLIAVLLGKRDGSALQAGLQNDSARAALARRGLQAYQSNGLALAEKALAAAYPVTAQLIGNESFAALARHLWRQQPPERGDLACWGAALGDFLDAAAQLSDEPFLGDVARIEWALHRATTAADARPDHRTFALLASGDSGQTSLTLSPGLELLASAYPAVSIIQAHTSGQSDIRPALKKSVAMLQAGEGEHALVWRQGLKPQLRLSSAAEHALVSALQAGLALEAALNLAAADQRLPALDFNGWLTQAVQTGLVTGAHLVSNSQEKA